MRMLRHIANRACAVYKKLAARVRPTANAPSVPASSCGAALTMLRRMHISVCGPFITPQHGRIFLMDDCILTEEELVALYKDGEFNVEDVGKALVELKHEQQPKFARSRRSQRIMLKRRLLIRTDTPAGIRPQIEGVTVVVNAHGGLLESRSRMSAGQRIKLVNPESRKEVRCRVVDVQEPSTGPFCVAFEFDERSAWFWPSAFPPLDWALPAQS